MVDDDPPAAAAGRDPSAAPDAGRRPKPDDEIDLSQLTDAVGAPDTSVDRVRELFPGAELVDED